MPEGSARPVRLTLRMRILVVVLLINAGVTVAGALLLGRETRSRAERETRQLLDEASYLLAGSVDPRGELNVSRILQWPPWPRYADAVLLHRNFKRTDSGGIVPDGVALNPLGRARRDVLFDEQAVYAAIASAILSGQAVEGVLGGRAVPITLANGPWGGLWYRVPEPDSAWALFLRYLLGPFLVSLLLLTGGTFLAMRRFVLDPVSELASGARRMAAGDFSVRLAVPGREDELADLMRGFNAMSDRVESFNTRLAEEVQRATEQARNAEAAAFMQRRLAATGELAAGIAHEVNNPLGGMLNALEVLREGQVAPARREQYFTLLKSGLERIRNTVGQLLRFTPRPSGVVAVQLIEPVLDAVGLVRHRARQQAARITVNGLDVESASSEQMRETVVGLASVRGEPNELGQALLNLLVNALDAMAESGTPADAAAPGQAAQAGGDRVAIELRSTTEAGERRIELTVSDNGPGVAPEDLGRVADLFFTTKDVGRGTGLGLALVFNAVETSGGRIALESESGAGFTARITWPVIQATDRPERPG